MLSIFKKRKKSETATNTSSVAKFLVHTQLACTTRLNRISAGWSRRTKIVFLTLFVALMVALTTIQIRWVIHPPTSIKPPTRSKAILRPQQQIGQHQDSLLFAAFLQRLTALKATPEGRDSLARFERARPGFIDSVMQWGKGLPSK